MKESIYMCLYGVLSLSCQRLKRKLSWKWVSSMPVCLSKIHKTFKSHQMILHSSFTLPCFLLTCLHFFFFCLLLFFIFVLFFFFFGTIFATCQCPFFYFEFKINTYKSELILKWKKKLQSHLEDLFGNCFINFSRKFMSRLMLTLLLCSNNWAVGRVCKRPREEID